MLVKYASEEAAGYNPLEFTGRIKKLHSFSAVVRTKEGDRLHVSFWDVAAGRCEIIPADSAARCAVD